MMAPDSTPHPSLSDDAVNALRSALRTLLADETQAGTLHDALRRVAEEARANGMQAEHLLIELKDIWFGLPEIRHVQSTEKQNLVLQRVVTLCVREYYSA